MLPPTQAPFPQYFGLAGDPLDDGSIYYGVANSNPLTAPIPVYWDPAGTQPVAQPVKTRAGYPVRSGTPANVFASGPYSVSVYDKNGALVYYAADSSTYDATVGRLIAIRWLTVSGIYDPTPGAVRGLLKMVGGGSGSTGTNSTTAGQVSFSGGGGSGAFVEHWFDQLPVAQGYTIGAGGAPGPVGTAGGAGGQTLFGTLVAPGGGSSIPIAGFATPILVTGGPGGANPTGGNRLNLKGNDGGVAIALSATQFHSGQGADSPFGVGGTMRANATLPGLPGQGYGSGASGPATGPSTGTGQVGAAGQPGVIVIYEYS